MIISPIARHAIGEQLRLRGVERQDFLDAVCAAVETRACGAAFLAILDDVGVRHAERRDCARGIFRTIGHGSSLGPISSAPRGNRYEVQTAPCPECKSFCTRAYFSQPVPGALIHRGCLTCGHTWDWDRDDAPRPAEGAR